MERVENSGNRNTFTSLMAEAREIARKISCSFRHKNKGRFSGSTTNFLFNDGSFHTVLKRGNTIYQGRH